MSGWLAAAQVLGTFAQMQGQQSANQANLDISRENREWQAWMSNSAHQRAVTDLKAAGLNPILAAGNAASTPQGSTAQMQNIMEGVGASALQAAQLKLSVERQKEELELIRSQKGKTNMETEVLKKGIPESEAKNVIWDLLKEKYKTGAEIIDNDKNWRKLMERKKP